MSMVTKMISAETKKLRETGLLSQDEIVAVMKVRFSHEVKEEIIIAAITNCYKDYKANYTTNLENTPNVPNQEFQGRCLASTSYDGEDFYLDGARDWIKCAGVENYKIALQSRGDRCTRKAKQGSHYCAFHWQWDHILD